MLIMAPTIGATLKPIWTESSRARLGPDVEVSQADKTVHMHVDRANHTFRRCTVVYAVWGNLQRDIQGSQHACALAYLNTHGNI